MFEIQPAVEGQVLIGEYRGVTYIDIIPPLEDVIDLRLDAQGSTDPNGDSLTYQWDLGDGNQAEGDVVVHTFVRRPSGEIPEDEFITIELIITDSKGASDTMRKRILIANGVLPPS